MSLIFRSIDITLSLIGIILASPIIFILVIVGVCNSGSPFFIQERLGLNKKPFHLVKLRTMTIGTASVPTHLLKHDNTTGFGKFLRKTKLDELPQLWNVLRGEMSLVGPRPGLASQIELTKAREKWGVFAVKPGITGLAQLTGIDMSNPILLAKTDADMIKNLSTITYFKFLVLTLMNKGYGDQVKASSRVP